MDRQRIQGKPVKENGVCPLWEESRLPGMAMLRECWFCKWSDFREDTEEYQHTGTCRNPKQQKNWEEDI